MGDIVFQRIDILKIINLLMLCSRRTNYSKRGFLSWIRYLIHSTTIDRISFHLQHVERFIQFLLRNSKLTFHTSADIDHAFFINLLFDKLSSRFGLVHTDLRILIQKRTDRRVICKPHLFRNLVQAQSIFSKRFCPGHI